MRFLTNAPTSETTTALEMIKNVSLPLTEMTTDELFTLLVGNKMIDVTNMKAFDPQAFRDPVPAGWRAGR